MREIDLGRDAGTWYAEYFAERRRNLRVPAASPATLIASGTAHVWASAR